MESNYVKCIDCLYRKTCDRVKSYKYKKIICEEFVEDIQKTSVKNKSKSKVCSN